MGKRQGTALAVLISALLLFSLAAEAETIDPGATLTLERCIAIALAANPDLAAEEAGVGGAEAIVDQKRAPLKPSVGLSSTHSRGEGSDTTRADLSVRQLLTDGGKSQKALEAARAGLDEAKSAVAWARIGLIYDVQSAFYELLRRRWDLQTARESLTLYETQLRQAEATYDAGLAPKSDVTAARVDLGQARLELTRAQANLALARSALEKLLAVEAAPDYDIAEPEAPPRTGFDEESALKQALSLRPDLRARREALRAAELNRTVAAKGMAGELSASGGYDWSDGDDGQWRTSLTLSLPLADGGLTDARVREAEASVERAKAREASLRLAVIHEVRQALLSLAEALENRNTTELNLTQAKENLDLAQGRYAVGVGSSLEISQAAEAYSRALKDRNQALYDHHLALAGLEKATASSISSEGGR
jgi:outer membrane protein TolC